MLTPVRKIFILTLAIALVNSFACAASLENHAASLIKYRFPHGYEIAPLDDLTQPVYSLANRLYQANGILVTEKPITDYKKSTHPLVIINDFNNAMAFGAGHIIIGTDYIKTLLGKNKFANAFDYMTVEGTIAHELTHNLKNHANNMYGENELIAERGALELMAKLPEGGYGSYLVRVHRRLNRPAENNKIIKSMNTKGFISISLGTKTKPAADTIYYYSADGTKYNLNLGTEESIYMAGQIADCIARGIMLPENMTVIKNELTEIPFAGDKLLIVKHNSLPNGYIILTSLNSSANDKEKLTLAANIARDYQKRINLKNNK